MKKSLLPPLVVAVALLCGCGSSPFGPARQDGVFPANLKRARDIALSWGGPSDVDALKGAALFTNGGPVAHPELALTRAILRTNPRLPQIAALQLADATARAARRNALPVEFLGATLLQESAYDPAALSSAGAIGIAQFMPDTATAEGVDPYDPFNAIAGAGALLGAYVRTYRPLYADPYTMALAAYNAGPGAVARYGGVPPYPETRTYVDLIDERWAQIFSYECAGGVCTKAWKRHPHRIRRKKRGIR